MDDGRQPFIAGCKQNRVVKDSILFDQKTHLFGVRVERLGERLFQCVRSIFQNCQLFRRNPGCCQVCRMPFE